MKKLFNYIQGLDPSIKKLKNAIYKVSFVIILFASYIFFLYSTYPFSHIAFLVASSIFKCGITIFSTCFICSLSINKLIKE